MQKELSFSFFVPTPQTKIIIKQAKVKRMMIFC